MRGFLIILLFAFIICQPNSFIHASKEERLERQKIMKAKLIKCINENGDDVLKEFIKNNENELRKAFAMNKDKLTQEEKKVIRECRKKIIEERHEEMKENGL